MRIAKGGCKIWTGALNSSGYPVVREGNKLVLAHRKAIGYTGDKTVHHTCGNKRCVNPAHLEVMDHAKNAGDTKESRKKTCKFGHDLSDAYISRDGQGREHRQCRTCKLLREAGKGPVSKHLEGKHDQSLHGNWANKLAGSLSNEQKQRLITRLSGPDRKSTVANLAKWMAEQDSSLPIAAWVGDDGGILDVGIGTSRRTPGFLDEKDPPLKPTLKYRLAMALDDAVGGKVDPVFGRGGGVVPHEDRLQRLMNYIQSPSIGSRRNRASDLVLHGPRAIPAPRDLKQQAQLGIRGTHWVSPEGKTRSVILDFDRLGEVNLETRTAHETGREYGAREYNALRADGLDHQEALNRVNDRSKTHTSGSLFSLLRGQEEEIWDKGLGLTANTTPGFLYAIDGDIYREGRPTQMRKVDLELDYREVEQAVFSKHLLGRHDQKTHGHKRDDHDLIREMKGLLGEKSKVNLVRNETKNPHFRLALERIKRLRNSLDHMEVKEGVGERDKLIREASHLDPETDEAKALWRRIASMPDDDSDKFDQRYEQRIERAVNSSSKEAKKVSKHLVGRHDQKKHGHRRGEHEFLKQLNGKLNVLINETKRDPSLRVQLDRMGYEDVTGRVFDTDVQRAVEAAQILRGDELDGIQRSNIANGLILGRIDMEEVDRLFKLRGELKPSEFDGIINSIRLERRSEGFTDVPAGDKERFKSDKISMERTAEAFLTARGDRKKAEASRTREKNKKLAGESIDVEAELARLEDADLATGDDESGFLTSGDNPYADLAGERLKITGIDKSLIEKFYRVQELVRDIA